jgi:precorrin-6B methylase 2
MQEKTVLAIDPGRTKTGLALVQRENSGRLKLLWRDVVPTETVVPHLHEAYSTAPFHLIIVGGGTHHREVVEAVRDHLPSMGILVVDETDSSLQARERYWEYNPRRGWRRLLPASLQAPPVPYDDFAAFVLAERVLQGE